MSTTPSRAPSYFYPRSPYGERRLGPRDGQGLGLNFYPRSPYGERPDTRPPNLSSISISIHALLTESDVFLLRKITITVDISIHALLTESDPLRAYLLQSQFISIHALLTESDTYPISVFVRVVISIHALLTESDNFRHSIKCAICNFYPRSPYGERPRA